MYENREVRKTDWLKSKANSIKKQVASEGSEVEKSIEVEMIKCFELALYQSHKSKTKKKQFTKDSYLTSGCMQTQPSSTPSSFLYILW